jgi:hypothetical protein
MAIGEIQCVDRRFQMRNTFLIVRSIVNLANRGHHELCIGKGRHNGDLSGKEKRDYLVMDEAGCHCNSAKQEEFGDSKLEKKLVIEMSLAISLCCFKT